MQQHSVFLWILVCYGILCIGVTLFFSFSNTGVDDLWPFPSSFDYRLVNRYREWQVTLDRGFEGCFGFASCTVELSMRIIDLFFLCTYLPLCVMLATFILSNVSFGSFGHGILPNSFLSNTEMPALEHTYTNPAPGSIASFNRRRTSSAGRSAARIEPQLIFDDTFGIIRQDIIELWSRPSRIGTDSASDAPQCKQRTSIPPVRVLTPKA